ncbi:HD-GYP domain-containing protein [Sphingorhabdus soli]|uniref:HD-GYP domain-containing protein n=1 Tax=Flavisphingopyxis soli TaxID=2601267 RepID=A0A5C6U7G4_9SPHN|nr:HD-GYP domain-containing protein [Sphingorhabdus soli]TXC68744.1 HD-GYP domain-containing protein [Sphingorhabdus soli]
MKREIPIDQLQIGMFVDSVGGSWFSNPFWRSRLKIKTSEQITAFVESGIESLVIDTDLGIDVADDSATPDVQPVAPPTPAPRASQARFASPKAPRTFGKRERAAETIDTSKRLVKTLFDQVQSGAAVDLSLADTVAEDICNAVVQDSVTLINMLRLKNKDEYTYLHSVAVCTLMIKLARQQRLAQDHVVRLGVAGLLHDIGKIGVPLDILNKPDELTESEFAIVKEHAVKGAALLRELPGVSDCAIEVCLHHHERMDGKGYPEGLLGPKISLPARMGAICDVYDALTSERSYKEAWSPQRAVGEMQNWDGCFDPDLLFTFFQAIRVFPLASVVKLDTGQLAVVMPAKTDNSPPLVRTFYDTLRDTIEQPEDLVLGLRANHAHIVANEDPRTWRAEDPASLIEYVMQPVGTINRTVLQHMWNGPVVVPPIIASEEDETSPQAFTWKAA